MPNHMHVIINSAFSILLGPIKPKQHSGPEHSPDQQPKFNDDSASSDPISQSNWASSEFSLDLMLPNITSRWAIIGPTLQAHWAIPGPTSQAHWSLSGTTVKILSMLGLHSPSSKSPLGLKGPTSQACGPLGPSFLHLWLCSPISQSRWALSYPMGYMQPNILKLVVPFGPIIKAHWAFVDIGPYVLIY